MPPQYRTPVTLPDALIIEADEAIRLSLRVLLEDAGYTASDAQTWRDARSYLRSHPNTLVILLDVSLPRPRDVALLQRAFRRFLERSAASTRRRVLVLLSTNPVRTLGPALGLALALGVPVVAEPFDSDDLLAVVASAARRVMGDVAVVRPGYAPAF